MDEERVQKIMDEMTTHDDTGRVIQCINVVKADGSEKAYCIDNSGVVPFIVLLLSTDSLMYPPFGYTMQVGNRSKAWFDRDKVIEMIKNIKR